MEIDSIGFDDPWELLKERELLQGPIERVALAIFSEIGAKPSNMHPLSERVEILAPRCTGEEKAKIEEIFNSIAFDSAITLAKKTLHIKRLGDEIRHVHPFSLLMVMPKKAIKAIFNGWNLLAKTQIIQGITTGMEREFRKNNVDLYIKDFAHQMGKDPDRIERYIRAHNWEGLLKCLYDL